MQYLELRVPPVAQVIIAWLLMWLVASVSPTISLSFGLRLTVLILALGIGLGIGILGVLTFKKAKTTVNPLNPNNASSLVNQGVYRITRNPMYLGLALSLLGFAVYLASLFNLVILWLFIAYMTRFQIKPEERALTQIFGQEYLDYQQAVRRWL